MAEAKKNNVINIDGKEYDQESMSNEQQYAITQIKDLQAKSNQAKFQLDQIEVALRYFTNTLIESVKEKDKEN